MPDHMGALYAKRIQEAKNIRDEKWPPIGSYCGWPGRIAEAAQIGCDHAKACRSQGRQHRTGEGQHEGQSAEVLALGDFTQQGLVQAMANSGDSRNCGLKPN